MVAPHEVHVEVSDLLFDASAAHTISGAALQVPDQVCISAGYRTVIGNDFSDSAFASIIGAAVMAVLSVPINYFLIYPLYGKFLGFPIPAIVGMYQAILPAADTLIKDLLIFNVPFTLVKGLIDAAVTFLIYKRLSPILKK